MEAFDIALVVAGDPPWTFSTPGPVFPPDDAPWLRGVLICNAEVPADPDAGVLSTEAGIDNAGPCSVEIHARNIPAGTTVKVRVAFANWIPPSGGVIEATSTPLQDVGGGLLSATAEVGLPPGKSEIQLRANWTP